MKKSTKYSLIESKNEVRARIDELTYFLKLSESNSIHDLQMVARRKLRKLSEKLNESQESISLSVIRSHKAICAVKQMGEKDAYGNDPSLYYTLAICGEAGEMANKIVKTLRNGYNKEDILKAVKSELPDVFIYSHVLAHVLDLDIATLVNEKVQVVIDRANSGYYGDKLVKKKKPTGRKSTTSVKRSKKTI